MSQNRRRRWSIRLAALTLGLVPIFQARAADGLVWQTGPEYRFAGCLPRKARKPGFTLLDPSAGRRGLLSATC